MTESPSSSPFKICTFTPSVMPVLTGRKAAFPSIFIHTCFSPEFAFVRENFSAMPLSKFSFAIGEDGGISANFSFECEGFPCGCSIGVPSAGANLIAEAGTLMAFSTSSVTIVQVAVIPGSNFRSGFSATITTE